MSAHFLMQPRPYSPLQIKSLHLSINATPLLDLCDAHFYIPLTIRPLLTATCSYNRQGLITADFTEPYTVDCSKVNKS